MADFRLLEPDTLLVHDDYNVKELREAIKNFYKLPPDDEIVLDLKRVYPFLGKEWQDVFVLYALGYPLRVIGRYWKLVNNLPGSDDPVLRRKAGNTTVAYLVKRIQWFLSFRLTTIDKSSYLR